MGEVPQDSSAVQQLYEVTENCFVWISLPGLIQLIKHSKHWGPQHDPRTVDWLKNPWVGAPDDGETLWKKQVH